MAWESFRNEDARIAAFLPSTAQVLARPLRTLGAGLRASIAFDRLRFRSFPSALDRRRAAALAGGTVLGCTALVAALWHFNWGPGEETSRLIIEDGDTVTRLFDRAGLSDGEVLALMEAGRGAAFDLVLVSGEEVRITRRNDGRLDRLHITHGLGEATEFVAGEDVPFTVARAALPAPAGEGEADPRSGGTGRVLAGRVADDAPATAPRRPSAGRVAARTTGPSTPRLGGGPSAAGDPDTPEPMQRAVVRHGDSLYRIFQQHGLPQTDLAALLASGEQGEQLKHLRPGQAIAFRTGEDGRVDRFDHELDEISIVRFVRDGSGFTAETTARDYDLHLAAKSGTITSSLFAATDEAGIPFPVAHTITNVLGWDIDFARDIREGDSFSIIYEELRADGRLIRPGEVLALEFRAKGVEEPIRAFRYTDANGSADYFAPDGRSLRRAFTRNPLPVGRISSRFSKRRLHPILNTMRPHRGVDYAAPTGTPIRATGDGVVTFKGRKGGYGKTIILSHGNGFSTLYSHLSRYGKRARKGARVKQGEVIGKVGMTGLATGPHLHYEFRIRGVHQDPLTVALPRAAPLDQSEQEKFRHEIGPLASRLDTMRATRLASLSR